jgi:sec-independent protein translocase protein TatB
MPHIGWFEILIIAAISIVVIGPKDFPLVLKKIGSWIGTIKRYVSKIQQEISILDNENIDTDSNNVKNNNKNNNKNNDKK